jgi:DNA-binding NarL/FixJ family response regulator
VGTPRIPVFLVEDHALLRAGIRCVLEASDDIDVVGEAVGAAEAISRMPGTEPRVALINVRLADGTGADVCREVRHAHPHIACLMLSSYADDESLFASILAGASGYLVTSVSVDGLIDAIRRVAVGQSLLDPAVTARVFERIRRPASDEDPRLASLTPLEKTILGHLVEGRTNREIAPLVHVSDKTVKNYVSSILRKLGLTRRTEAAVFALRANVARESAKA